MNNSESFDLHQIRKTLDKILAVLESDEFPKRIARAILNEPMKSPTLIEILGASADHVEITDLTEGHIP